MTDTFPTLWHLYMLRLPSGMLYTGITTDVARRLAQHQAGKGAKALRGKGIDVGVSLRWGIAQRR